MNDFGVLMRFMRERSGLSARALSEKSDLSLSYVSKMEKGTVSPTVQAFSRIIANLAMSDKELLYMVRVLAKGDED